MDESVVIQNRRTAKGRTKPIIFFLLQLIAIELLSILFYAVFYDKTSLILWFLAVIQIVVLRNMIYDYKRAIQRQKDY